MSRLGTKTYGRGGGKAPECLSEKGNKPSTAKVSVAGIHRWGMTSYTSLRKARLNGERQKEAEASAEPVKRAKLDESDPFSFEAEPSAVASQPKVPVDTKPRPNKFFKSGSRAAKDKEFDALRLSVPNNNNFVNIPAPPPVFLTSTTPNIVDLRYTEAPKFAPPPSVHFIRPFPPPPVDASAFDELMGLEAADREDDLFGAGTYGTQSDILSSQPTGVVPRLDKDMVGGCKDDLFGAASGTYDTQPDVLSSQPRPTGVPHLDKDVVGERGGKDDFFGASSQESCKTYGTQRYGTVQPVLSSQPRPTGVDKDLGQGGKDDFFVPSSQESRKTYGTQRDELSSGVPPLAKDGGKDDFFGTSSQEEDFFGASSQESLKEDFAVPMDSGRLMQDSQASSIVDFSSSQSSEKSTDSSGGTKNRHKKIFSSSSKFKAVYNHRHWHSSKKTEEAPEEKGLAEEEEMAKENFNDDAKSSEIAPYSCHPKASNKEFYTVVKNVKQAYQCHESGETQEFNDDIEYLLECVQECNGTGTRCLSVLNLATKCMSPAFRIHLRAHGTMPKIFSALQDAPRDPNLSLCTAALMFVLSQDRLTMDIEASTLSLMLQLLEEEEQEAEPEADLILRDPALCAMQDRHREKVGQLCEEMRMKGHAKHLKMDNINTGILAMETLLSLTSRKAGEWFKEEMRTLRGLDRIADTVTSSMESLLPYDVRLSEAQLDRIRKIDRCLRVLENVTHMNPENQEYLLSYKDSLLISSCLQLLRLFKTHLLAQGEEGGDVVTCLLNLLKILSNITYGIALDDSMFPPGDGLMDQLLMLILQVPRAISTEKRFDLLVLSLGLMINLVEYCSSNSAKFVEMHGLGTFDGVNDGYEMLATEALVELMCERLESARLSEEQADELLSTQEAKHAEKKDSETAADDLEETLMKTLQKAGKHMEHSIIAAYIVILLGCVSQKHPDFIQVIKDFLPNGNFDIMVEVLKKFKSFVSLTGSVGSRELGSIQKVIHLLESS